MLKETDSLVQKLLISLGIDGEGDFSFPSAWDRLLEFERNGRSYMLALPGTILHTDHYNTVQILAAMLLREAGNRIVQQFSQSVDWEVIPYKFPLLERSHFWNEMSFYEKEEEKLQSSKMSHPGLAVVLAGGGGGDALSIFSISLNASHTQPSMTLIPLGCYGVTLIALGCCVHHVCFILMAPCL